MPVDLSASIFAEYKRSRKRAEEAERRGEYTIAAGAYRRCAYLLTQYAEYTYDATVRQQRMQKAKAYEESARRLELKMDLPKTALRKRSAASPPVQGDVANGDDDYEAVVLALIQKSSVKWEDIGGLEETKEAIKTAYGLALARKPKGVQIKGGGNVLLFGPPGTGKTLLAAATAGSLDAAFFNVKVSDLLSKYFGESTRLISALYTVARRLSPAVIFLDEFEALTPPRGSGESGAERRIVSTLLAELDGMANKGDDSLIITMGATNLPWLLDTAILSRFIQRVYVPLPDAPARQAILEIHLVRRGHHSRVSMADLVKRTGGYSGREIEQICQLAITHMTGPANPHLLEYVDKGQEAIRDYEIKVEALTEEDFKAAFDQVRPVANGEMLLRFDTWQKQVEA